MKENAQQGYGGQQLGSDLDEHAGDGIKGRPDLDPGSVGGGQELGEGVYAGGPQDAGQGGQGQAADRAAQGEPQAAQTLPKGRFGGTDGTGAPDKGPGEGAHHQAGREATSARGEVRGPVRQPVGTEPNGGGSGQGQENDEILPHVGHTTVI